MAIGLGTRAQLGIGIAVYLEDKFSQKAKQINEQLKNLNKNSLSYIDKSARDMRNQSAVIAAGAGAVTAALYGAAQQGAEFQHTIRQIKIIGGKDLKESNDQLTRMAESLASGSGLAPLKIAQTMVENIRAGVTEGLEEITKGQVKLSISTGEAIEGAMGVGMGVVNTMNQFGMSATQMYNVGGKMVTGIDYITNALQAGANKSVASVYDIQEALSYFGGVADRLNLSLEESVALIAQLSPVVRGSGAGTGLANMMRTFTANVGEFAGPTKKAALAKLGMTSEYAINRINKGESYELMQDIAAMASKLSLADQVDVGNRLFNNRGDRAAAGVFRDFMKGFVQSRGELGVEKMREAIIQGIKNDVLGQQYKKMMDDLFGDMKKFGSELLILKNKFVAAAGPTMRIMASIGIGILKAFGWIMDSPIGKVFASLAVIIAPMAAIFFGLRAAALTAAFALRAFTSSAIIGARVNGGNSFRQMLTGVLGGPTGIFPGSSGKNLRQNSAGSWITTKGNVWKHPITGMAYKGGQMTGMAGAIAGNASRLAGNVGTAATGASLLAGWGGKAVGLLGRIAGLLGPIGLIATTIYALYEIWDSIWGDSGKARPELLEYQRSLYSGMRQGSAFGRELTDKLMTQNNININIDGVRATQTRVDNVYGDITNTQFDHVIPSYP